MRATDIVRQVLDLLDQVEGQHDIEPGVIPNDDACDAEQGEPIAGRFKQIFAMLDAPSAGPLANSPNEVVADVEDMTTAVRGEPQDVRMTDPEA